MWVRVQQFALIPSSAITRSQPKLRPRTAEPAIYFRWRAAPAARARFSLAFRFVLSRPGLKHPPRNNSLNRALECPSWRTTVRLRRNQLCPIHRSQFCCGREAIPRESRQRQLGVRRIDDPHHPRGYREIRSNAEMRKLMDKKIVTQNGECGICHEKLTDYGDIVPDHIHPRGMGGAWRDDHPDNIQAVHWWCNGEKGSSRG